MRWVAIFEDTPQMQTVRAKHEPAHFAYLKANQKEILLAGGLREGPGSPFAGGLWVLAPMPKERAVELIEQDPYFIHSKRGYKLLQWGKALQEISASDLAKPRVGTPSLNPRCDTAGVQAGGLTNLPGIFGN